MADRYETQFRTLSGKDTITVQLFYQVHGHQKRMSFRFKVKAVADLKMSLGAFVAQLRSNLLGPRRAVQSYQGVHWTTRSITVQTLPSKEKKYAYRVALSGRLGKVQEPTSPDTHLRFRLHFDNLKARSNVDLYGIPAEGAEPSLLSRVERIWVDPIVLDKDVSLTYSSPSGELLAATWIGLMQKEAQPLRSVQKV